MSDESIPPYLRIAGELEADIASGKLQPGSRVPSITTLSQEYGVGKGTAVRALRVLEDKGLVVKRQGWGTFVATGE